MKSDIRTTIIENVSSMLHSYVANDKQAVQDLLKDLLSSRKWKQTFGDHLAIADKSNNNSDTFLQALVKDYKSCKDKESNVLIRANAKQLKQPLKIGGGKSESSISYEGKTAEELKSRTAAARKLGRVSIYAAERRRLLSIVANDYSQYFLMNLFQCAKSTVTAARVHCILFGRGGMPPPSWKFTRQRVSQEVLDGLSEFLLRDDISRPSSCRSVMVNGEECPVRYWQNSIKGIVQQYLLEFPDGVKRTYIYTHLPKNFRSNSLLAGLCNLCEDFGYANFSALTDLVEQLYADTQQPGLQEMVHNIQGLQRYLKTRFSKEVIQWHRDVTDKFQCTAIDNFMFEILVLD